MNGGMQRCFHIMHQLAKHFKLTAIIHQDKNDFLKSINDFPAIASAKVYSTKDFQSKDVFTIFPLKLEKALRYRWYRKQLDGPANDNYLLYYPVLKYLLTKQKFDVVILENLATLNAIDVIRKYDKQVKIIYDAHNVDTNLAQTALAKKEIRFERLAVIREAETNLYKNVNAIFTCSKDDKDEFVKMNNGKLKAAVVPNGVIISQNKYDDGVNRQMPEFLLFCGSLWSLPNAEGLYWFCKKIWPAVLKDAPNLKLLVVGSGNLPEKYSEINQTENVEFAGQVDDVKPWYNKAAISVVPLLAGSGTRLKILEAMGMGVPVIATSIGAEGIDYIDGKQIIIANEESDFADQIISLLKNKDQRQDLSSEARKLVISQYDWNVIGGKMASFLNNDLEFGE